MLTPEELKIAERAKELGKTPEEALAGIQKYRATQTSTTTQAQNGVQDRLAQVGTETGQRISSAIQGTGQYAESSPLRRGVEATAAGFSAVPKGAVALAPEPVRKGINFVTEQVGSAFKGLTDWIGSNKSLQEFTQKNPEATKAIIDVAGTLSAGGEIASNILAVDGAVKVGNKAKAGTTQAFNAGKTAGAQVVDKTKSYIQSKGGVRQIVAPQKDIVGATGEVIQGKTKDVAKAIDTFKQVDISGVKTFDDLGKRIDDTIKSNRTTYKSELAKDTRPFTTNEATIRTSVGNKTAYQTPVDDALNQLSTYYNKINDVTSEQKIHNLMDKYVSQGLTLNEIDDIAVMHGKDLNAFNASGELASGLTKQAAENTRAGIKKVIRQSTEGETAAMLDKDISSMINTRKLVTKNIEKVNLLKQRIANRGILEKAAQGVVKYANLLSGGVIRGITDGLLNRGTGLKVLNALDLEQRLAQNLKIIEKALRAKTEQEILKALKELDSAIK